MTWFLLLAFAVGATLPMQSNIKAVLCGFVGSLLVATISFFVGALTRLVAGLALCESRLLDDAAAQALW